MRTVLLLATVVVVGCKSKDVAEPDKAGSSGTTTTSEKKVPADELGTFTCKDLQADVCIGPTDTFEATTAVIHITYKTKNFPQNGDVYAIRWIAEDVGESAPANTVITTIEEPVKDMAPEMVNYVVNSRMSQPTKGWPIGSYRVEVERKGTIETVARFTIQ